MFLNVELKEVDMDMSALQTKMRRLTVPTHSKTLSVSLKTMKLIIEKDLVPEKGWDLAFNAEDGLIKFFDVRQLVNNTLWIH